MNNVQRVPITCFNVFYKVISKIIANWITKVLDSIVVLAQAASIEVHSISNNIHLAQELFKQYHKNVHTRDVCTRLT